MWHGYVKDVSKMVCTLYIKDICIFDNNNV